MKGRPRQWLNLSSGRWLDFFLFCTFPLKIIGMPLFVLSAFGLSFSHSTPRQSKVGSPATTRAPNFVSSENSPSPAPSPLKQELSESCPLFFVCPHSCSLSQQNRRACALFDLRVLGTRFPCGIYGARMLDKSLLTGGGNSFLSNLSRTSSAFFFF